MNGSDPVKIIEKLNELEDVLLGSTTKENRYQIRDAVFALENHAPPEYIVDQLFPKGSVSVVPGAPGSFKTMALLSCGVRTAIGEFWIGFSTNKCNVLFVDEESGEQRLSRRLGDVLRGEFGNAETPIKTISLARFDLRDPGDARLLQDEIERQDAELVIIDALVDIMPGADENLVKDVHPVFMRLRKIAEETGAAIVVIHHTNRSGGYRGSSAISGAVDLMLIVESKKDSTIINFTTEKARDIEPINFAAEAHWIDGKFWLTETEFKNSRKPLSELKSFVSEYLAEKGPSPVKDIMNNAEICSPQSAKRAVYDLAKLGITTRVDEGRPGTKATYALTEKGIELAKKEGFILDVKPVTEPVTCETL